MNHDLRRVLRAVAFSWSLLGPAWGFGSERKPCLPSSGPIWVPAPYRAVPPPQVEPSPRMPNIAPVPKAKPTTAEPPSSSLSEPRVKEMRLANSSEIALEVPAGRCRVGFWNVTGRDITLTVNGQATPLAKDQALTLYLERNFTWQVPGRPPQVERIADSALSHEVVLRP
ncbi:MAG: hypothetical protein NZO58_00870 [Gemmataceae bacterium]|nr:hypothetical protein [Gemmataceae bacterium]